MEYLNLPDILLIKINPKNAMTKFIYRYIGINIKQSIAKLHIT